MTTGRIRHRAVLALALAALIVVFGFMFSNLLQQLEDLSSADRDNSQWNISQLDTEFANLSATLAEQSGTAAPNSAQVRLRLDIAVSRLNLISAGKTKALFDESSEAMSLADELTVYAKRAIAISEQAGELSLADVRELRELTQDVRPSVRRLALIGVAKGAEFSSERRRAFSRQLILTGGIAIGLLLLMTLLMFKLSSLMQRAAQRDRELLASSQQLASTVAASLDAIVTADDSGKIIEFNSAAEEIFGWKREEIIGLTMEETFIPHRMREAHNKGMERYLETREPRVVDGGRVELAALRRTGEEFPVELNITSVVDGNRTKFIAYIRDISERKINEQNLIDARDRAERMDSAKSQFLTVMSHEMRTPLNGVLGVLDLLMQTKLDPKQERYVKIAIASSEVLLEHTNEALDITRIETGTLQLTHQDFDLPGLVDTLFDALEPLAQEKGLRLTYAIDDDVGRDFHGDGNRIRQILTNLIGNAVKFTDAGSIDLGLSCIHAPDHSVLKFAVRDTGAGIPEEFQEPIFEDFVALSLSEGRQRRGDGLGLSISRKIARQMGGDIVLESKPGAGSTFTLTVPMARAQASDKKSRKTESTTPAQQLSRTVLVVEDNDINRSVLREILEGLGHKVVEAEHGQLSLERASEQVFDAILMDISMPVMDGIEATKRLRGDAEGLNAKTVIFGLTAHGHEEYKDKALAAGMNRLYTKPIRIQALQSILNRLDEHHSFADDANESDVLDDLIETLGVEKTEAAGQKFFDELAELVTMMEADEQSGLVDEVHKAKGAASLLGFSELVAPLQSLEEALRAKDTVDLVGRADVLQALSKRSQKRFAASLRAALD